MAYLRAVVQGCWAAVASDTMRDCVRPVDSATSAQLYGQVHLDGARGGLHSDRQMDYTAVSDRGYTERRLREFGGKDEFHSSFNFNKFDKVLTISEVKCITFNNTN